MKQAKRCNCNRYDVKAIAGDTILQQCDSVKLHKKVIVEDLKLEDIIKHGLAYKQSEKKIVRVTRMMIIWYSWSRRLELSRLAVVKVQVSLQMQVELEVD